MPKKLSHYDRAGRARMVDVSAKSVSKREAEASAFVLLKPTVLEALPRNPKGDPLEVARLAGIMGAKRTAELIPLCHPLPLSKIDVTITPDHSLPGFRVRAEAKTTGRTGVEMEALPAAGLACLTLFDMLKAVD